MKSRIILLTVIILLSVVCNVFADRQLEEAEVQQILQQLTSQPKETWIDAGTIQATHQEYSAPKITDQAQIRSQIKQKVWDYQASTNKVERSKDIQKMRLDATPFNVRYELSNEYTMVTNVILKYDGERFYCEINVESRTDSVKPDKNLAGNFMTDEFNLDWNGRRVFAWDGENHTRYTSANYAAVNSKTDALRGVVGGPLNAGIIPWGMGHYTYSNLIASGPSAVERFVEGRLQIELTLDNLSGMLIVCDLDVSKNYAVVSCTKQTSNATYISQYSDHQLLNGRWVPNTILLEKYEPETERLLKSDLWEITSLDGSVPAAEDFNVEFDEGATVEYVSDLTDRPVIYQNSSACDVQTLLAERLLYAVNQGSGTQNCATASLKYALGKLDKEVTDSQLAALVEPQSGQTGMLAMKQFVQSQGLYCKAVTTDIETLQNINTAACQVILHLPGKDHFVLLESIDENTVKVIDLVSDRFYYSVDTSFFDMGWTEGTALLVSNNVISGDFAEIAESDLALITGATGYAFDVLLQEYNIIHCVYMGGMCGSLYHIFFDRWGCGESEYGFCFSSLNQRRYSVLCVEDMNAPQDCTVYGFGTIYMMMACQ